MKGLKLMLLILVATLVTACGFSQNLQPKPIQLDNQEGVFISIDLMDSISLKLIDRTVLIKENKFLNDVLKNTDNQIEELKGNIVLYKSTAGNFESLYKISEKQKTEALESFKNQKLITDNLKKNRLKTVSYISGAVCRSDLSHLHCS